MRSTRIERATEILRRLADGLDPETGQPLPAEHRYQHPDAIRAMYTTLHALEERRAALGRPAQAFRPWQPMDREAAVRVCVRLLLAAGACSRSPFPVALARARDLIERIHMRGWEGSPRGAPQELADWLTAVVDKRLATRDLGAYAISSIDAARLRGRS